MDPIYVSIRTRARRIADNLPVPAFYRNFPEEADRSRQFLRNDPTVSRLRRFMFENADNELGHGFWHAERVTIDAGTLMLVEYRRQAPTKAQLNNLLTMIQCAGLLHDVRRRAKNHAVRGAEKAREILQDYSLTPECIEAVCLAISNHEAFQPTRKCPDREGALISDCLYDADKFRWGPDNFTHTVWDMVAFANIPVALFVQKYPEAMKRLAGIGATFRTDTGKKYGPEFIEQGLEIGRRLMGYIENEIPV